MAECSRNLDQDQLEYRLAASIGGVLAERSNGMTTSKTLPLADRSSFAKHSPPI